jgi:hypothetical protein
MGKVVKKVGVTPRRGVSGVEILYLSSTLSTDSEYISIDHIINGRCLVVQPIYLQND